jgi:hypothetical protein
MRKYYPTGLETDAELAREEKKNLSQEERLLTFFRARPELAFTAREIHALFSPMEFTSVHRCLSNLTDRALIEKIDMGQRSKKHNKPVHSWKLKPREPRQDNLF